MVVQGTGVGRIDFALQITHPTGANGITTSSDIKLEIALDLGGDYTVNYSKNHKWLKQVFEITNRRGADNIIDGGGPSTIIRIIQNNLVWWDYMSNRCIVCKKTEKKKWILLYELFKRSQAVEIVHVLGYLPIYSNRADCRLYSAGNDRFLIIFRRAPTKSQETAFVGTYQVSTISKLDYYDKVYIFSVWSRRFGR